MSKTNINELKCLIGILLFTFLVFSPVLGLDFLKYDDIAHVTGNSSVRSLSFENIKQIFSESVMKGYIPLTTLSFALEYKFFKYFPFIYHLDNLLLHLAVTGLAFWLARRLGFSFFSSFIATALFAVHPIHVESVAWVTERKDVLYALFYLASIHAYLSYIGKNQKRYYCYSLVFGILSMLAKPMALSLPLILLVVHWYKEKKFRLSMVLDKLPYFVFIIPLTLITWMKYAQKLPVDFFATVLIKIWVFIFYIQKIILPVGLSPVYETPASISLTNPEIALSVFLFTLYIIVVIRFFRKRAFMLGNLFFIGSIFFLLRNDFDVHWHTSFVVDRFMYLPSFGLFIIAGYFTESIGERMKARSGKTFLYAGIIAVIILLSYKTSKQIHIWQNDDVLWDHAEQSSPTSHFAKYIKGVLHYQEGRYDKAVEYFTKAINLNPVWIRPYYYRGLAYEKMGLWAKAINGFTQAIEKNRDAPEKYRFEESNSYFKRGILWAKRGEWHKALGDFTKTIELDPVNAKAYNNRGLVHYYLSEDQSAINDFNRSIELDSSESSTYVNRDRAYQRSKM